MQFNKRVLIKFSGEFINPNEKDSVIMLDFIQALKAVISKEVKVAIVVGGGNVIRGRNAKSLHLSQISVDHSGILATIINGIVLRDILEQHHINCSLMSAKTIEGIVSGFHYLKACEILNNSRVLISAGGTGVPLITSDSAAALRAVELNINCIVKISNIDKVYDADPNLNHNAVSLKSITLDYAIKNNLQFMDREALSICQRFGIKILVLKHDKIKYLPEILSGSILNEGTWIH